MSEREFTRLVVQSVGRSLGRKLLFVFLLTNAQLNLTKRIKGLFEATTILHDEIHASV